MKVLLIGGRGYLGRSVSKNLSKYKIYTFDRSKGPKNHFQGSITSFNDVKKAIEGMDVIINLVGLSPIKKPENSYSKVHVLGVRNILFGLTPKQRLIHISALGADSSSKNEYLRTKGKAELLIEGSKAKYAIIRPSILFSKESEVFTMFSKPLLFLVPNFKFKFQPVYVDDVAQIIAEILSKKKTGIFQLGGNKKISFYTWIKSYRAKKGLVTIMLPSTLGKIGIKLAEIIGIFPKNTLTLLQNNTSDSTYKFDYTDYFDWLKKH